MGRGMETEGFFPFFKNFARRVSEWARMQRREGERNSGSNSPPLTKARVEMVLHAREENNTVCNIWIEYPDNEFI